MPARRWPNRWSVRAGVLLLALLLVNALTLLPAWHRHGPEHRASDCAVCLLQSTTAWAPAIAPEIQGPKAVTRTAEAPPTGAPLASWRCVLSGRSPPVFT